MEIYIAVIAALTALVAVIVGPLVSLHIAKRQVLVSLDIAKRQFNASVLSVNRQEWINTLRDEIADQLADIARFPHEKSLLKQTPAEFYERVHKMSRCTTKIQLLLNPGEEDHRQLVGLFKKTILLMVKSPEKVTGSQLTDLQTEIVSKSQEILKREWERVKEGQ